MKKHPHEVRPGDDLIEGVPVKDVQLIREGHNYRADWFHVILDDGRAFPAARREWIEVDPRTPGAEEIMGARDGKYGLDDYSHLLLPEYRVAYRKAYEAAAKEREDG